MSKLPSLGLFLLLVVGGGLAIGLVSQPGPWYEGLAKPAFNPPDWIFAPVWTVLYILIAVAGWRVWQKDRHSVAMRLWWIQLLFNFVWSPTFFVLHSLPLALTVILLLLVSIVAFIVAAARLDRIAAGLFLPYLAWVAFATVLNASLMVLNP
jgi:tryptophan-rich sensory protein